MKLFSKSKSHTRGFTLIELLVVIAIISLLSSVVLATLNQSRLKSQYAALLSSINSFKTEAEIVYSKNGNQYNPTDDDQQSYTDCINEGINFFENPGIENIYKNMMQYAGIAGDDYVYCYVGKDYYAISFKLNSKFAPIVSSYTTICFDSGGKFTQTNEDIADNITSSPPHYCNQ